MKTIILYSTYFLSRYSTNKKVKVNCQNPNCGKVFITNIGRKRCSKQCASQCRRLKLN